MKKIKKALLLFATLFATLNTQSQVPEKENLTKPPRWCSDKGFWVVQSNVKTPDQSLVRFYTVDGKIVYAERVNGVVLDCTKRKTLMKLKRVLEKVVDTYEAEGEVKTTDELATFFNSKQEGLF